MTDSQLKEALIDCICYDEFFDWDDLELVSFWDWLFWALGLTNS